MPTSEDDAILETARRLFSADRLGRPRDLLRGRHVALLCESDDAPEAVLFRSAVTRLGARTAHIRLSQFELRADRPIAPVARMLGRLYVAVECQGLGAVQVARLGRAAGIPAFDGIAGAAHPTAALAWRLPDDLPLVQRRCYVLQGALLRAIG